MTGWHPGIETLYVCEDYAPSRGILGQVTPGICDKWLGAHCELGMCPCAGQPPVIGGKEHGNPGTLLTL